MPNLLRCFPDPACLISFAPHESLEFQGIVRICLLRGKLFLYGHVWDHASSTEHTVYAPCSSSLPLLTALPFTVSHDSWSNLDAAMLAREEVSQFLLNQPLENTVVLFSQAAHKSTGLQVVEKYFSFKGLFTLFQVFPLDESAIKRVGRQALAQKLSDGILSMYGIPGFLPVDRESLAASNLKITTATLKLMDGWEDCLNNITNKFQSDQTSLPVVLVCGAKGSGKSTFSRFCLNWLLNHFAQVAWLDLDLGQPELTCPGMISLSLLDAPLFGPAFTHVKREPPFRAWFLGTETPKDEPDDYVTASLSLFEAYQKHLVHSTSNKSKYTPLIINTHGWVKGIGLDILLKKLTIIRPSHIVQIGRVIPGGFIDSFGKSVITSYQLCPQTQAAVPFLSRELRHLSLSSWFWLASGEGNWQFYRELTAITPYRVAWDSLKIWTSLQVPIEQLLYALNGVFVGLIAPISPPTASTTTEAKMELITALPDVSEYKCLGLGLVRSVDPTRREFLILTPLSSAWLETVVGLARGEGLALPLWFYGTMQRETGGKSSARRTRLVNPQGQPLSYLEHYPVSTRTIGSGVWRRQRGFIGISHNQLLNKRRLQSQ